MTQRETEIYSGPCGVCGKPFKSWPTLQSHASIHHKGVAREVWQPGYVRQRAGRASKSAVGGVTVKHHATGESIPIEAAISRNQYSKIVNEKPKPPTVADAFVGMPWPKPPKTAADADRVAAALSATLRTLQTGSPEHEIILSQRDYYLAFGARMRRAVHA